MSLLTLGTAGIVAAVILSAAGANQAGKPNQSGDLAAGSSRIPFPAGSASTAPAPVQSTAATSIPKTRPTVVLRVVGARSWIRVTDSHHRVLVDGILTKGKVLSFTGPVFYIEVGDAGAVTIADKGMRAVSWGPAGQPAHRTVKGP